MAIIRRVNILKRVKLASGWQFCAVVYGGGGKIRPDVILVKGVEEVHPEGQFYLDYYANGKRIRKAAGATAAGALAAAEEESRLLTAHDANKKAGIGLPEPEIKGGRSLREAVKTYLLEIAAHKKPKTLSAYTTALTYFLESCHKDTLESLTRTDLLAFRSYLKAKGQSDRSQWNKFASVMSFLKQNRITGLANKNDWPVYTEEEVSTYTDEELQAFFAACDETEALWFRFFYVTAMREQEVQHAEWNWVDFENKMATVRENKRFGFKPKAYKGRSIPLTSELIDLLKAWKAKSDSTCGLIFPTSGCNPKLDFLDVCKAIAKRAGLNDFYLHKFRATRATHLLQDGMDIKSVQRILGHSDLESTMRYLGTQRGEVLQAQVEGMTARF